MTKGRISEVRLTRPQTRRHLEYSASRKQESGLPEVRRPGSCNACVEKC